MRLSIGFLCVLFLGALLSACGDDDRRCSGPGCVTPDGGMPLADGAVGVDVPPGVDGGVPGVDSGPPPEPSPLVDPACVDGMYRETIAGNTAPIDGIAFTDLESYVNEILLARYPIGAHLTEGGLNFSGFNCVEAFSRGPNAEGALSGIGTIVHECGHLFDLHLNRSTRGSHNYVIRNDMTLTCPGGDTVERGGNTVARSLINSDDQVSKRPACPEGTSSPECDFYAHTYLIRDGSEQGFSFVIEEAVQYVNSLAVGYAFLDQRGGGSQSDKDGILTFLWYVERYLRLTRMNYPEAYAFISGSDCWRNAILTLWGRAWLYLEHTKDLSGLDINGPAIEALVMEPAMLEEIQRIRDLHGC